VLDLVDFKSPAMAEYRQHVIALYRSFREIVPLGLASPIRHHERLHHSARAYRRLQAPIEARVIREKAQGIDTLAIGLTQPSCLKQWAKYASHRTSASRYRDEYHTHILTIS
jgi:hypothetical protein